MGDMNVKSIGYAEIEDFLFSQKVTDKTKANMKSCLHDFWQWLRKRNVLTLAQMPEFPEIKFELGWRNIIDLGTQAAIKDEVYRISSGLNPKIWIGIHWLSVYIAIRPGELRNLQEKHIDREQGLLIVPSPKEKRPKIVPLIQDDVDLLKSIPRGLPELYFFRHGEGVSGATAGSQFGKRYFYKWWKRACNNLGIDGVTLWWNTAQYGNGFGSGADTGADAQGHHAQHQQSF